MRRPTGPGKIRVDPIAADPDREGLSASLFNFDIDDATLKVEHQKWLNDNAVPVLRADSAARIFLTGTASQSGANAHNLTLSKSRVEAVKKHLLAKRVQTGQIDVDFTGEEASVSKSSEDETDRAVNVFLEAELIMRFRNRTTHVRRFGTFPDGFDEFVDPPWVMVPLSSFKKVLLENDSDGVTLVSSKPEVAKAFRVKDPSTGTTVPGVVEIEGKHPGTAQIKATDAAGRIALLDVSVKKAVTFTLSFNLVFNGGSTVLAGTRSSTEINQMFQDLKDIFKPQTNIDFVNPGGVRLARLDRDLGAIVRESQTVRLANGQQQRAWEFMSDQRDPKAIYNVFFVWEIERDVGDVDPEETELDAVVLINKSLAKNEPFVRDILMENDFKVGPELLGIVLAHEAGHFMGIERGKPTGHNNTRPGLLMNQFKAGIGGIIPKKDANNMNPD